MPMKSPFKGAAPPFKKKGAKASTKKTATKGRKAKK